MIHPEITVTLTPDDIKLYDRAKTIGIPSIVVSMYGDRIKRLLVEEREQEREACAKVCEERIEYWQRDDNRRDEAENCAAAIRARGASMTDKKLLELAAKAAGINLNADELLLDWWNPLACDGDAMRLAVELGISIEFLETTAGIKQVWATHDKEDHIENAGEDPYAATRRAIVRAAAEIGKGQA